MSESNEECEGKSWMVTVLEWWGLWGLKVLDIAWLFLAVFPVQYSRSCWSETSSVLWSGMSDFYGRSCECGIGWDYASWCHGISGNGGFLQPKGGASCCSGWMRSMRCAFLKCCFCHSGNGSRTVTC